jgi:hypothetical protein
MRFIILTTAVISVLAFVSQSASALPGRNSHLESSQLSKRRSGGGGDGGDLVDFITHPPPAAAGAGAR